MISTFFPGREVKYLKKFSRHVQKGHLRITFCDPNIQVSTSLSSIFEAMPAVAVAYGNALKVKADAIVSPTNSFGDMSGGMDKHIDDFCKGKAQSKAMEHIRRYYLGELPVGVALILHMNQKRFPFIVIAPTMRIPGNVCGTINAYLAMRATLVATIKHNKSEKDKIRHIVIPGLCTGIGRMPYEDSSEQMLKAYKNIMLGNWKQIVHPAMAPYVLEKQNLS